MEQKEEKDSEKVENPTKLQWPPLESDPKIFNDYFHSIGLPKSCFFKELITLVDFKEFLIIEGPLISLILNFSRKDKEKYKNSFLKEKIKPSNSIPFFIKQTPELDNACGLIAALHSFGNNSNIKFENNSILEEFYNKVKDQNYEEKAITLENFDKFKKTHVHYASHGQTKLEKVEEMKVGHYVCFTIINNCLFELDGLREGPYLLKENVQKDDLLDESCKVILERINNGLIDENVNVMLVGGEDTKITDLLLEE